MIVKGITIHNTGNSDSAQEIYQRLLDSKKTNLCHYIVDEKEVVNCYPVEMEASHTGKGYDFGNRYTIAIEIARSMCDEQLYIEAQNKAIELIKNLMSEYDITNNDLYFHMDFNPQTKCPHRILEIYKTKERFINECNL